MPKIIVGHCAKALGKFQTFSHADIYMHGSEAGVVKVTQKLSHSLSLSVAIKTI